MSVALSGACNTALPGAVDDNSFAGPAWVFVTASTAVATASVKHEGSASSRRPDHRSAQEPALSDKARLLDQS